MLNSYNSVKRVSSNRQLLVILAALCLTLIVGVPDAKAAFIVSFRTSVPDPLVAGGGGFVDVLVRSDQEAGESLEGYQVGLTIAPGGESPGPVDGLIFSDVQVDDELTDPNYVFVGNSFDFIAPVAVGEVTPDQTKYIGSDITYDFAPVMLELTERLLFRLDISALTEGTYTISIDTLVTSFFSDQNDPLGTPVLFSSTAGTLKVIATPEPSSLLLISLGSAGMLAFRRRRRVSAMPPMSSERW